MKKGRRAAGVVLQKTRALPWPLLSIFLFLATAIAVSAYVYFQQQKNTVIHEQTIQLRAIAELKSAEIEHWLQERRGDARLVMENRMLAAELLAYLADRAAGPRREAIRKWMASLRKSYRYRNVILLDSSRQTALVLNPEFSAVGPKGLEVLEAVRRRKDVVVSDLHISAAVPFPHLDVALPLLAENRVAGYVLLRIDPADFLFPRIQSWPTPSPSAETLLAERRGDSVLFLNELRHRRDTAMKLRLPLKQTDLPAAQAVEGRTGATTGHDYRGVAVWAVIRPVAGTSWFIVAKVDRDEMERPIRRSALAIFLVALSFILAAALTTLFLWQRQDARFRLGQLESENQKLALVQHFDYLTRYANDIILLTDEKWNILEANERALVTYGHPRNTLLQLNLRDLRTAGEREGLATQYAQVEARLGMVFETVHQKKDGSLFPIEVSARLIEVKGKKYFQVIGRDISERKQAEFALRESETLVRSVLDNLPIGIAVNSINPAVTFDYMNDRFPEIYHTTRENLAGPDAFWKAVYQDPGFREEIRQKVLADCASGDPGRMNWEDVRIARQGEEPFFITARNVPVPDKALMISLVWDVTERKRAEIALRESEEKFKQVFETANVGKSIIQLSGEIQVNKAYCDMLGYSQEELQKKKWQEFTPAEEIGYTQKMLEPLLQGRQESARFNKKYVHKNGALVWADVSVVMRRDPAGKPLHFITTVVDITERKKAEEELQMALARVRKFIDANIIGIIIADTKGKIIETNDYYLQMIGFSREEFEKGLVDWRAITPPEWLPADEKALAELNARGVCTPYEKEYLRRDGRRVPVYLADAMLPGPGGQIAAFAIDMTERKRAESQRETAIAALRQSEKRLKETQEMARLGHWQWDVRTGAVEWSAEVYKIFQLDPAAFTPQIDSILALSPWPEDHQRDQELIRRAMESREKGAYEQRFLRPDNSIGYYHSTFQGIYDAPGNLLAIIGTVQDITESKKSEAALRESERKFRETIINLDEGYYNVTMDGKLLEHNQAFSRVLGFPADQDLRGMLLPDFWQDPSQRHEYLNALVTKGSISNFQINAKTKQGGKITVLASAHIVRDKEGRPQSIEGVILEITSRQQMEEALQASYSFLQIAFRHTEISSLLKEFVATIRRYTGCAAVGIRLLDEKGNIPYSSYDGFSENFYEKESPLSVKSDHCMCINVIRGTTDAKLPFYTEGGSFFMNGTTRFLATVSPEEKGRTRNECNQAGYESVALVPIRLKDRIFGLIHVADPRPDMVPIKIVENLERAGMQLGSAILRNQAEEEIRKLNAELELRVQQRTAQLEAANKELEAFSYSVSHDLRAPLRAIDGFSRIVAEEYAGKLDDEGLRLLGVIIANTRKMGQLIDDLLAFSRLSRQQMARTPLDLATLADSVFKELKSQEPGRRIEFKVGELPVAHGDHAMLRQVLRNLLANAIKFTRTRARARIRFSGRTEGEENIYTVEDNGVGFDPEYAHKLFGVFQRLHDIREFEGTGVGLAIVQRIVMRHGGSVSASSKIGNGARFCFSLPANPGLKADVPAGKKA